MLLSLFLFGSLGFWILLGAACLAITAAVEWEKPGLATLTLVGFFAALGFFGDFNVLTQALAHPSQAATVLIGYLVAGTVWSVVKWWFFVRNKREGYEDAKRDWLNCQWSDVSTNRRRYEAPETGPVTIPDVLKAGFARHAKENLIPSVRRHKSLIMSWMMYWPWSMVWTMINDPVRRAFKAIFLRIKDVFVRIRNRAYGDISADLPTDYKLGE